MGILLLRAQRGYMGQGERGRVAWQPLQRTCLSISRLLPVRTATCNQGTRRVSPALFLGTASRNLVPETLLTERCPNVKRSFDPFDYCLHLSCSMKNGNPAAHIVVADVSEMAHEVGAFKVKLHVRIVVYSLTYDTLIFGLHIDVCPLLSAALRSKLLAAFHNLASLNPFNLSASIDVLRPCGVAAIEVDASGDSKIMAHLSQVSQETVSLITNFAIGGAKNRIEKEFFDRFVQLNLSLVKLRITHECLWAVAMANFKKLKDISLGGCDVDNDAFEGICAGLSLEKLDLTFCKSITQFRCLSKMLELTELKLCRTNLDSEGLEHISRLPRLSHLDISSCDKIADFSLLAHIKSLTRLIVQYTKFDDHALAVVSSLPLLSYLDVSGCGGISSFSALGKSKRLDTLCVNRTNFADVDLQVISILSLTTLFIENSKITDWAPFLQMAQLTSLHLRFMHLSDDSVSVLYRLPLKHLSMYECTGNVEVLTKKFGKWK